MHVVIPDDYQAATRSLDFLHSTPGFKTQTIGDLARDTNATTALAQADALILIRERTVIDAAFLRRTPNLKLISQTGKIAPHIDLDACTAAGIAVVEGVGSPVAPAELTWLLIMAAQRQFVPAVNAMASGQWQVNIGRAVAGQTLGILGFGKIGKRIAHYAQAFDMRVQVWGSERAQKEACEQGFMVPASRAEFFASSDIITVHQRLVPATQGNITLNDLLAMKRSATFVNTSRAELVETGALLQALDAGTPGFAALDVYEQEPIYDCNHPLLQRANVLCTPHLGYVEQAGYDLYIGTAFDNAVRYFSGERGHVLNKEVIN
ncbi:MAG: D-2-hydroxyacid dehydrogenase family protein [Natronospirillum sp.]